MNDSPARIGSIAMLAAIITVMQTAQPALAAFVAFTSASQRRVAAPTVTNALGNRS